MSRNTLKMKSTTTDAITPHDRSGSLRNKSDEAASPDNKSGKKDNLGKLFKQAENERQDDKATKLAAINATEMNKTANLT